MQRIVSEITDEENFIMIRNLLATTAIATLVATGAFAQDATTPAPAPADPAAPTEQAAPAAPKISAEGHLATQIIGESIYNGTGDEAENIGDVNDIVIATDGKIEAVVVGVGGFLGIGEKDVAVDFAQLEWAERSGDRWLVAPMTREQLETQAPFDRSAYEPEQPVAATEPSATPPAGGMAPAPDTTAEAPAPAEPPAPAPDATAEAPATTTPVPETTTQAPAEPAPSDQMAQKPAEPMAPAPDASTDTTTTGAIDKSQLKEMPATDVRAEEMIGTKVYGAGDVDIGEIGDIVLKPDGKVDAYVVDVGGFLGAGEKEVAIGSDNLAFMTDAQGNKYLYTNFTKEQLDAAAAYDEATYTQKRDDQRLMMTQ
jgi:sporulation protein YlmC with PRC-barrel domain